MIRFARLGRVVGRRLPRVRYGTPSAVPEAGAWQPPFPHGHGYALVSCDPTERGPLAMVVPWYAHGGRLPALAETDGRMRRLLAVCRAGATARVAAGVPSYPVAEAPPSVPPGDGWVTRAPVAGSRFIPLFGLVSTPHSEEST